MREILRDRRTIITLLLMPLLVYPLLSILFLRLQSLSQRSVDELECRVGLSSEEDAKFVEGYLALGEKLLNDRRKAIGEEENQDEPPIEWVVARDLNRQVAQGQIDVAIVVDRGRRRSPDEGGNRPPKFEIVYRDSSSLSRAGLAFIEIRLHAVNEGLAKFLAGRLAQHGEPAQTPATVEHRSIKDIGATVSLTTLIPLILILMTITGAVYPAIDLTAGERERGTLQSLMAAPVPRLGLLTAKYVAVVMVAMLTAGANLFAMSITLVCTGLSSVVFGDEGLTPTLIALVFALLILFAAFFSAILLALTSFARSFKEAQAYLIPVMLLALAPGMMSLMPEMKFNGFLSVLPLVNIVLLARDLFEGQVDITLAIAAVLSTGIYAMAAIALAARIFGTDAILYGSQASWADLLFRPGGPKNELSVSAAMLCLALLFPMYFLLANLLARQSSLSLSAKLGLSAAVTAALFALIPLILAALQRVRIRETFRLQPAGVICFLSAAVLGVSLWPLAHEVFLTTEEFGLPSLSGERIETARRLIDDLRENSLLLILLSLAITPAVCEELFFRGYLFSAFRRVLAPTTTILLTAALFGVFHVVVTSMLAVERLLPRTFLGLLLGWVCWRTGSVLPGMLLHACHNGLLLTILYYRDELMARGWGVAEERHLPKSWLALALLGVIGGMTVLLYFTSRPRGSAFAEHQIDPVHQEHLPGA